SPFHSLSRCATAVEAASPASFQPSNAATMTGSISSGTPSSSITQRLLPTCPRVRPNLTACPAGSRSPLTRGVPPSLPRPTPGNTPCRTGARGPRSQPQLQGELVVQRDAVLSRRRDGRLEPAGRVGRAPRGPDDAQPAPLVEAQGVQVVVGGHQPQPSRTGPPRGLRGRR